MAMEIIHNAASLWAWLLWGGRRRCFQGRPWMRSQRDEFGRRELPGFRSRWMIPWECRHSIARAISMANPTATRKSKHLGLMLSKYLRREPPSRSSVTTTMTGSLHAPMNCDGHGGCRYHGGAQQPSKHGNGRQGRWRSKPWPGSGAGLWTASPPPSRTCPPSWSSPLVCPPCGGSWWPRPGFCTWRGKRRSNQSGDRTRVTIGEILIRNDGTVAESRRTSPRRPWRELPLRSWGRRAGPWDL